MHIYTSVIAIKMACNYAESDDISMAVLSRSEIPDSVARPATHTN